MANNLGILEVANGADLAYKGFSANTIMPTGLPRSRWNEVATVRVMDHEADDNSEQDDPSKMALFSSKALLAEWKLGGTRYGNAAVATGDNIGTIDYSTVGTIMVTEDSTPQ